MIIDPPAFRTTNCPVARPARSLGRAKIEPCRCADPTLVSVPDAE